MFVDISQINLFWLANVVRVSNEASLMSQNPMDGKSMLPTKNEKTEYTLTRVQE